MAIDHKTRQKLITLFKGVNYRKLVAKKVKCHPNTVSNVLLNGTNNLKVEAAIMKLGKELKETNAGLAETVESIAAQL